MTGKMVGMETLVAMIIRMTREITIMTTLLVMNVLETISSARNITMCPFFSAGVKMMATARPVIFIRVLIPTKSATEQLFCNTNLFYQEKIIAIANLIV